MVGDVVVRDVVGFGDVIDELLFVLFVTNSHEWNTWDGEGDAFFRLQHCILVPDLSNDFIEVVPGAVRFCGCHFEHETSVFEHQGEIQVEIVFSHVGF